MLTYTVTIAMTNSIHDPAEFTIFDPQNETRVSVVRRIDNPSTDWLASIAQAGIEQFFNLGPATSQLCHGWSVKYESNNNGGANLIVMEFDYDSGWSISSID